MEETRLQKRNWKRIAQIVILIASLAVCAVSIYNIVVITAEDQASGAANEKMRSYVSRNAGEEPRDDSPASAAEAGAEPTPTGQLPEEQRLAIDFEGLRAVNPEVIAWIDIPSSDISYPIVQSEDKDYYLDYSADGTPNRAGAIFADYRNQPDFSEHNTIIYGHRMNNGSMFGSLNQYADEAYAAQHPYIYIYVPGEEAPRVYEVFSTRETAARLESDAYRIDFPSDGEFLEWTQILREDGNWIKDAEFKEDDVILTLSTCVRGNASNRFVVEAKRVS